MRLLKKLTPPIPRLACLLSLVCLSIGQGKDATDDLEAMRVKVAAEEAKAKGNSEMRGARFSLQLKQLQALITRENYDQAEQTLQSLGSYTPSSAQDDWSTLAESLGKEIQKRKAAWLEKMSGEISQLVKDARAGCLEAKSSSDLDALLLRCSALQLRQNRGGGTAMSERVDRKLRGVAQTLTSYADYLDFKDAGDSKRANMVLRNLSSGGGSELPVLTMDDIQARFVPEASSMTPASAFAKIFDGVNSPDELGTAAKRLETFAANPANSQLADLRAQLPNLNKLMDAWKATQGGDAAAVAQMLARSNSGYDDLERYLAPIKAQIYARILTSKASSWTKLPQNPGETAKDYLGRVLDELAAKGDYATMLDVMVFAAQLDPSTTFGMDRQAIEQFLAGQRFEKIGDGVAAVTSYRIVVGFPAGKYAPTAKAQDALVQLEKQYPDAFKNYEGVVLEQMRALRQQIQILLGRSGMPGRPY